MEIKAPKKPGRKPINIDIIELERLAGMGLSERQIASALDISNSTLTKKKHIKQIKHALKKGRARAVAQVSSKLFDNAMEGKETSAIFFLKNRDPENWQDRVETNHTLSIGSALDNARLRTSYAPVNILEGEKVPDIRLPASGSTDKKSDKPQKT